MKILIVNNNTRHIEKLSQALAGHELEIITYKPGIKLNDSNKDLVILSGGGGEGREVHDVRNNGDLWYKDELKYILNCEKPLIGICMGFELIAHAYGAKIEKLDKGLEGFEKFKTKAGAQITQYESRDYCVPKIPSKHLTVLARSKFGIEMLKHNSKRVLGVQFHPELGGTLDFNYLIQRIQTIWTLLS